MLLVPIPVICRFLKQGVGKMQERSVPWIFNTVAKRNYAKLILEKWAIKLI